MQFESHLGRCVSPRQGGGSFGFPCLLGLPWLILHLFMPWGPTDDMTCGDFLKMFFSGRRAYRWRGGGLVPVCPAKRGVYVVHTGVSFLPLLLCGSLLACFSRDGQEDPRKPRDLPASTHATSGKGFAGWIGPIGGASGAGSAVTPWGRCSGSTGIDWWGRIRFSVPRAAGMYPPGTTPGRAPYSLHL